MIPTKIEAADAWPMRWKIAMVDCKRLLSDGEDATRSKHGDALDAGLAFVRRVGGNDTLLVGIGEMRGVVNRGADDGTVGVVLVGAKKTLDYRAHSQQRREAQIDNAACLVRSR